MSRAHTNTVCLGGAPASGEAITTCQQCGVVTYGLRGCYSAYESDDPDVGGCILHLCLSCAEPYIALDALRA